MSPWRLVALGLAPLVALCLALILLKDILLPFLVGMGAAYLLDPLADRLERLGLSRIAATSLITFGFFVVIVGFMLVLLPPLLRQAAELASQLPVFLETLRDRLVPKIEGLVAQFDPSAEVSAQGLVEQYSGQAIGAVASTLGGLLQSGVAVVNVIALLFVTPVVTFYLLRDWDRLVARVVELIPPDLLPGVTRLAGGIDEVLAGFIRGQGLLCLFLALFYSVGLWLVGLRYGLIIGLLSGLFSFIPFIGTAVGLAVGLAVAAFQFQNLAMVLVVALVFGIGQFIEGNILGPRLVGSRIHLHPVWMIFAALAGTALFGLLGTFLAVPVAGAMGVCLRVGAERYRASRLFGAGSSASPEA
jgi:predicted PurR-regulated permease PerM